MGNGKKGIVLLLILSMMIGILTIPSYATEQTAALKMPEYAYEQAKLQKFDGFIIGEPIVDTIGSKCTLTVDMLTQGQKRALTTEPFDSLKLTAVKSKLIVGSLVDYHVKDGLIVIATSPAMTFNRVLSKSAATQFDTMKYGPELSPVKGPNGKAIAGNMVAAGWVYGKTEKTITVGDGKVVDADISGRPYADPVKRYEETYTIDQDTAVYHVNTANYAGSSVSDFASIPVTADYAYTTLSRQAVYVVFDRNYTQAEAAKVDSIYYFSPLAQSDGKPVWDVPTMSYLLKDKGIEPITGKPYIDINATGVNSAAYTRSTEPFEIVKDTFYWVGDNEVAVYLFNADMGTDSPIDDRLIMLDAGWPVSGYQYWKNIEIMGYDPRKVTDIMLTHGHGDHYGTAVELITMIENAGGKVKLWGSYVDTYTLEKDAFGNVWNIDGALPEDQTIIKEKSKGNDYKIDTWYEFGNVQILATPTAGHTIGTLSFIFKVKRPDTGEWVSFGYNGGYGFNGLEKPTTNNGYLRLNFQLGLAWLQQMVDVDFVAPQHANHYPMIEVYQALKAYNRDPANADKQLTMLDALTKNEFINQMEKRYSVATNKSSDAVNGGGKYWSIETYGPFKPGRENGLTGVQATLIDAGKIIQGYNSYFNINPRIPLLKDGLQINLDAYTHDPDGWYVQFYIDVKDGYGGYLPLNYTYPGAYNNTVFRGGPIETFRPAPGTPEILRTQRLGSKAEAETILKSVQKGGTYLIDLTKASAIIVPADVTQTFRTAG